MKITHVRVLSMGAPTSDWNWTFVKIETDSGVHGIGEGSLQCKDAALQAELGEFGRWLVGQDPFRIEHIWSSLHRRVHWTGGPVTMSAISAVDLALHDIKAKALGIPVYELLGGIVRDRVRLYANAWFQGAVTPEEYAERARAVVEQGYTALKFYPFAGAQTATPARIDRGIALVRAVREAVGPAVEIAIDVRANLNMRSAIRAAKKLEPFDIAWIEEPVLFDNVESLVELARAVPVPVATGEQLYGRWEFRPLLERNAVRIIQPDICHAGGISELKKIAAAAETYYVTVAPHNSNGPISTVASLHLDASIPNCLMQEVFLSFLPLYNEVLTNPIAIEDGYARLPAGPGWGTDIDEDVVRAHPPNAYSAVREQSVYY